MKMLRICPVVVLATAIALPAFAAKKNEKAPDRAAAQPAAEEKPAGPEARLVKGMPAAEVLKVMGRPADVSPMETPSGKAEIWRYRERVSETSTQVQVGSKPITISQVGADNQIHTITVAEEPIYKMQMTARDRVVALLVFNDQYLEQKVTFEDSRRIQ